MTHVLDIGAYDGFFSFGFERRGAEVLSVDIWNDIQWKKFRFAIEKKQSKIKHQRIDVHDLSAEAVGGSFDSVFCAGVLYHLRHPLLALQAIRSVTGRLLILETVTMIGQTKSHHLGVKLAGAGGYGYMVVISENEVDGGIKITSRR